MAPKRRGIARKHRDASIRSQRSIRGIEATEPQDLPALLRLPAELSNRIYGYVLLEPDRLDITKGVEEPPLLHTCWKLRDGFRPMWYLRNAFTITVVNCKAENLIRFIQRIDAIPIDPRLTDAVCDLEVNLNFTNDRMRPNLFKWCRAVHKDIGVEPVEFGGDRLSSFVRDVEHALNQAKKCRAQTWEDCEQSLRAMLGRERYKVNRFAGTG